MCTVRVRCTCTTRVRVQYKQRVALRIRYTLYSCTRSPTLPYCSSTVALLYCTCTVYFRTFESTFGSTSNRILPYDLFSSTCTTLYCMELWTSETRSTISTVVVRVRVHVRVEQIIKLLNCPHTVCTRTCTYVSRTCTCTAVHVRYTSTRTR